MRTMKPWITILAISAAVFFAVLWMTGSCDKPTTPPSDNTIWRDKVAQREEVIREKDSVILTLERLVVTLKKERTSDSSRLTKVATVNFNRYKQAKEDIRQLRDSLPVVRAFVEAADSLIAAKDSLYLQEVGHRIAMEQLYEIQIAELGQKNVVQQQISQLLESKVVDLEGQNAKLSKRLERKKRGNRLLLGIAAGLGAAIAVITLTQ